MAKSATYWAERRRKQGGRFLVKGGKALMAPSVASVAQAAWSGVKYLRTLVNSEAHVLDASHSSVLVANTPVIFHFNAIAQGDGQSNRMGNSVLMRSIHRTEYTTTAVANTLVREILFLDKQQISDTAPVATDILESGGPVSLYNKLSINRFKILEDKIYTLSSAQRTGMVLRNSKKLNVHATYNGGATNDIQKNGLYKLIVADTAASTTGSYRLFYHDN